MYYFNKIFVFADSDAVCNIILAMSNEALALTRRYCILFPEKLEDLGMASDDQMDEGGQDDAEDADQQHAEEART